MSLNSKYLFIASMDVDREHDAIFNEVYDKEHIPNLSRVPGIGSVARYRREELTMIIGGEKRKVQIENEPMYTAIYELESPEVLSGEAWSTAVEKGRWPAEVRPYTQNRRHVLLKLLNPVR